MKLCYEETQYNSYSKAMIMIQEKTNHYSC